MVIGAVAYHYLSLRWLRAPAWRNKQEARAELRRLLAEHESISYDAWTSRIGQYKRIEFKTTAGTWYQARIEPVWDGPPGRAVRVLVSIDDGGVGAYHPLTDCLLVEPPPSLVTNR
jgi:hypothetical protein